MIPGIRVLVVDDDAMIRAVMGRICGSHGIDVVAVASNAEGLKVLVDSAAGGEPVDVLQMDHNRLGGGGPELLRAVRELDPGLVGFGGRPVRETPIVVFSGEAERRADFYQQQHPRVPTLEKPARPEQLLRLMARGAAQHASWGESDWAMRGRLVGSRLAWLAEVSRRDFARPAVSVLVVDDDPLVSWSLQRLFRHGPVEILTAADNDEALAVIEGRVQARKALDLVQMDHIRTGGDGLALLSRLRALPDAWELGKRVARELPVVVWSASAAPEVYAGHPEVEVLSKAEEMDVLFAGWRRALERAGDEDRARTLARVDMAALRLRRRVFRPAAALAERAPHVLLVEQDTMGAQILSRLMGRVGIRATWVSDDEGLLATVEALAQQEEALDLVLVDPIRERGSAAVVERLRELPDSLTVAGGRSANTTPFVWITGAGPSTRTCFPVEAPFVEKPIGIRALFTACAQAWAPGAGDPPHVLERGKALRELATLAADADKLGP